MTQFRVMEILSVITVNVLLLLQNVQKMMTVALRNTAIKVPVLFVLQKQKNFEALVIRLEDCDGNDMKSSEVFGDLVNDVKLMPINERY